MSDNITSSYSPVDLESIKKKLAQLKSTNKKQQMVWKPSAGDSVVRIVPYRHAKDPFNVLYFHYELGNRTGICLQNFAKDCPICEFATEIRKKKTEESWNAFKKIQSKMRVYIPILVRGKESEGVKFWGVSKNIYETLLGLFDNPEYGDITHPVNGIDITVKFTAKSKELQFGKIEVFPKRNSSPLLTDKNSVMKLLKEVPNIFEIYPEPTNEELKKMLEDYLNPKSEDTAEVKNDSVGEVIDASSNATVNKLDEEFDNLFKTTLS